MSQQCPRRRDVQWAASLCAGVTYPRAEPGTTSLCDGFCPHTLRNTSERSVKQAGRAGCFTGVKTEAQAGRGVCPRSRCQEWGFPGQGEAGSRAPCSVPGNKLCKELAVLLFLRTRNDNIPPQANRVTKDTNFYSKEKNFSFISLPLRHSHQSHIECVRHGPTAKSLVNVVPVGEGQHSPCDPPGPSSQGRASVVHVHTQFHF